MLNLLVSLHGQTTQAMGPGLRPLHMRAMLQGWRACGVPSLPWSRQQSSSAVRTAELPGPLCCGTFAPRARCVLPHLPAHADFRAVPQASSLPCLPADNDIYQASSDDDDGLFRRPRSAAPSARIPAPSAPPSFAISPKVHAHPFSHHIPLSPRITWSSGANSLSCGTVGPLLHMLALVAPLQAHWYRLLHPLMDTVRPLLSGARHMDALILPAAAAGLHTCTTHWGASAKAVAYVLLVLHHLLISCVAGALHTVRLCSDAQLVGYWVTAAGLGLLAWLWRLSLAPAPLLLSLWALISSARMEHRSSPSACNCLPFKAAAVLASCYSTATTGLALLQHRHPVSQYVAALPDPSLLLRLLGMLLVAQLWVSIRHAARQAKQQECLRGRRSSVDPRQVLQADGLMVLLLLCCCASWQAVMLACMLLQKVQLVHVTWQAAGMACSIISKYTEAEPAGGYHSGRSSSSGGTSCSQPSAPCTSTGASCRSGAALSAGAVVAARSRGVAAWREGQAALVAAQHSRLPAAFASGRDWLQRLCWHAWAVVATAALLYQPPFAFVSEGLLPACLAPTVNGAFVVLCCGWASSLVVWVLLGAGRTSAIDGMHHHLVHHLWEEKAGWLPGLAAAAAHHVLVMMNPLDVRGGRSGQVAAAGAAQGMLLLGLSALDVVRLAAAEAQFLVSGGHRFD